jgi:LEA14-like dessication related protein
MAARGAPQLFTVARTIAALALLTGAAISLASCANAPPPAVPSPLLSAAERSTSALDQHRTELRIDVRIENPADVELSGLSLETELSINGKIIQQGTVSTSFVTLSPRCAYAHQLSYTIDSRILDSSIEGFSSQARAAWQVRLSLRAQSDDGRSLLSSASASGSYQLIREPTLSVQSIRILQYELVNSYLQLVLEVRNPNDFPIDFSGASYQFYGEGQRWASGKALKAQPLPPRGSGIVLLPINLNFADTGRSLFDLVAQLKTVRYRLSGTAVILTGLDILPSFDLSFDAQGSTRVER